MSRTRRATSRCSGGWVAGTEEAGGASGPSCRTRTSGGRTGAVGISSKKVWSSRRPGLARVADDAADAADAQAVEPGGGAVQKVDAGRSVSARGSRGCQTVVVAADAYDPAEALGWPATPGGHRRRRRADPRPAQSKDPRAKGPDAAEWRQLADPPAPARCSARTSPSKRQRPPPGQRRHPWRSEAMSSAISPPGNESTVPRRMGSSARRCCWPRGRHSCTPRPGGADASRGRGGRDYVRSIGCAYELGARRTVQRFVSDVRNAAGWARRCTGGKRREPLCRSRPGAAIFTRQQDAKAGNRTVFTLGRGELRGRGRSGRWRRWFRPGFGGRLSGAGPGGAAGGGGGAQRGGGGIRRWRGRAVILRGVNLAGNLRAAVCPAVRSDRAARLDQLAGGASVICLVLSWGGVWSRRWRQ